MTEKELERLKEIDQVIAEGKYQDTWESLQQYEQPRWFRDAKFGISFTGACTVFWLLQMSGIPGICIFREVRSLNIM